MISILYIGNKISHLGFTKTVIETLGPQLESAGFKVHYAGEKLNHFWRLMEMIKNILKFRKKISYLLIDTYSTSAFWYAYICGMVARIFNIKYIPILHGGNLPYRINKSKVACNALFKHSYINVAVSGFLFNVFTDCGYNVIIIPNNIDILKYPFLERKKACAKILWVRSFHKMYNPDMALDVLSILLKTHPDAELCMVGPAKDGSLENFKETMQRKGLSEKVRITGLLSQESWVTLSAKYDFFINTTNIDNTPVSVIEALALGMLVISTNVGGIPFLLNGNNAVLVKPFEAENMANSISRLIFNEIECEHLSNNARSSAELLDWNRIKEKWKMLLS